MASLPAGWDREWSPGIYLTRDGRVAWVTRIESAWANGIRYPLPVGIIEGDRGRCCWLPDGQYTTWEGPDDLVKQL